MKKLLAVFFRFMHLVLHFSFLDDVRMRLAIAGEAVQDAVAPYLPEFLLWLGREEAAVSWERKSELTRKIAATDKELARIMVAINGEVQTGRHSSGSAIVASGEKVYDRLQHYGHIMRKPYAEQVADLKLLLKDFAGDYAHDVDNLGMGIQVQLLQRAFDTFVDLLGQRDDERVEKPPYTGAQTRKELNRIYRQIAFAINASAATAPAETVDEFITFIEHLNTEIARINAEVRPAKKNISVLTRLVIVPIPIQIHTGLPIIVIPELYYIDDDGKATRMWLGKDFEVSYRNNTDVGTAEVIIHGKGEYTGQATVKFNIARKPLPTEES